MSRTAKAEVLTDFTGLARAAASAVGRCRATGLDPIAYRGLVGAAITLTNGGTLLNAVLAHVYANVPVHRRWRDDHQLLGHIATLDVWWMRCLHNIGAFAAQCEDDHAEASALLGHEDADVVAHAEAVIADCDAALEILGAGQGRLQHALRRLRAVPEDLGEHYVAAYNTLRRGHVLPYDGRWITGDDLPAVHEGT